MRIIAGKWKGRTLHVPKDATFRPTTDRVRESVFSMLDGRLDWSELRVCDLFAGSGSLCLEALSRGAAHTTFVERQPRSLSVLQRNITSLSADAQCRVQRSDVTRFLGQQAERYGLIFADPPYAELDEVKLLSGIARHLSPGGLAVVEHDSGRAISEPVELTITETRRYGTTSMTFLTTRDAEAA